MDIKLKLKSILFLQFFVWGSWLITLGGYMAVTLKFEGVEIGLVYSSLGIASFIMPSILGVIADRWISANKLYIACQIIGAIMLAIAANVTTPGLMFVVMLINCLAFMPTISMINAISYYSMEKDGYEVISDFPAVRIWGTIGFIIAMWTVSLLELELSANQLYISSFAAIVLSLISLSLPNVPIQKHQEKKGIIGALGLDAFALFAQPKMAIFFLFSIFLGAILQINISFSSAFLHDFALVPEFQSSLVVKYPSILMSLSQISEVFFILCVPFFMKRFGIKYVMLISMLAWALRFGLFGIGDPSTMGTILLILSMIVYGCAFDFYNISGSLYVEKSVPTKIRSSAQGLFMTMSNGVGAFIGANVSGLVVDYFTTDGIKDWPLIWFSFAGYALVLALVFLIVFKENEEISNSYRDLAKIQ